MYFSHLWACNPFRTFPLWSPLWLQLSLKPFTKGRCITREEREGWERRRDGRVATPQISPMPTGLCQRDTHSDLACRQPSQTASAIWYQKTQDFGDLWTLKKKLWRMVGLHFFQIHRMGFGERKPTKFGFFDKILHIRIPFWVGTTQKRSTRDN